MKINIQTILFLSVFAIIAPQVNAEEKSEFKGYQIAQVGKFLDMDFDKMTREEYLEARILITDLATSNPETTRRMTRDILCSLSVFKNNKEVHFLFDKNVELNVAVLLSMFAINNKMALSDTNIADLRARLDGVSDSFKDEKEAEAAANMYKLIRVLNSKISE